MASNALVFREWTIAPGFELRVDTTTSECAYIELLSGHADINSAELPSQKDVILNPGNTAVLCTSSSECKVLLKGAIQLAHIIPHEASFTSQLQELSLWLDEMRTQALKSQKQGPRVLICGELNGGKRSVSCHLLNLAARNKTTQWKPLYIDADPGNNMIAPVGCIAVAPWLAGLDAEEITSALCLPFFFGHTKPTRCLPFYKELCTNIASYTDDMSSCDGDDEDVTEFKTEAIEIPVITATDPTNRNEIDDGFCSGIIVKAPSMDEDNDNKTICSLLANVFDIDVIVVVGSPRFAEQIKNCADIKPHIVIRQITNPDASVRRSQNVRVELKNYSIFRYFRIIIPGLPKLATKMHIRASENVQLAMLPHDGAITQAPDAALPLDTTSRLDPCRTVIKDLKRIPVNSLRGTIVSIIENDSSDSKKKTKCHMHPAHLLGCILTNTEDNISFLATIPILANSITLLLGTVKYTTNLDNLCD